MCQLGCVSVFWVVHFSCHHWLEWAKDAFWESSGEEFLSEERQFYAAGSTFIPNTSRNISPSCGCQQYWEHNTQTYQSMNLKNICYFIWWPLLLLYLMAPPLLFLYSIFFLLCFKFIFTATLSSGYDQESQQMLQENHWFVRFSTLLFKIESLKYFLFYNWASKSAWGKKCG